MKVSYTRIHNRICYKLTLIISYEHSKYSLVLAVTAAATVKREICDAFVFACQLVKEAFKQ
jgi:hypothetical protein